MTYLPNQLNEYSTYTYNIAIYMVNPRLLGSDIDPVSQGILMANNAIAAEFNIASLTHTHSLDPGVVRSSMGSMFDIIIYEQNGAQFLEAIALSAARLGIPDHLQAAYAIVIKFKGRKDDNVPNELPQVFKYYTTFKNVGIKVDPNGSTYNITAVETFTDAFNYLKGTEKMTLTYDAATVGEAVEILEKKIKDALEAAWALDPNSQYADEIKLEFDESTQEWARWQLEAAGAEGIDRRDDVHIGDRVNMSIFAGTSMHEYLNKILEKTQEYKRLPTYPDGYARESPDQPTIAPLSSLKYGFKIITKVENLEWDILRQDYQKRVTFRIKKHLYPNWIVDSAEYLRTINSPDEQRNRLENIKNAGLLRKRYDYLFTGNNTEVLNLDLNFDMSYYVISPVGGGILGDPGVVGQQGGRDFANTVERIRQAKKKIADRARALQRLNAPGQELADPDRLLGELGAARDEFRGILDEVGLDGAGNADRPPHPTPITFALDVVDDGALYHSPGIGDGAAIMFGAAKMNLENTKDLATIEMTIRGDPYWMGQPNGFLRFERNAEVELATADYELGGAMFYLHVKFPNAAVSGRTVTETIETPGGRRTVTYRTYDDDDGRFKPSLSYSFSGIYQVTNVISEFRSGLFKQTLKAYRDVSVNPGILNEPENAIPDAGTPAPRGR
jgi:hypothetical protein